MTFPTIPTTGASRLLTIQQADTTATRTWPAMSGLTRTTGDLLLAIIVAYQSSAASGAVFGTWASGWTELTDQGGTTSNLSIGAAYRWADGSEVTPTVTQAATITGQASMVLMAINGAHASQVPAVGTIAHGTAAAADPGALTPAWGAEDNLWIAVGGSGETAITGSWTGVGATPPTNYSNLAGTATADTSTVGQSDIAVAFRQLNAASEDVGTFSSVDVSNARNSALVIAVRPAPPPADQGWPILVLSRSNF